MYRRPHLKHASVPYEPLDALRDMLSHRKDLCGHIDLPIAWSIDDLYAKRGGERESCWSSGGPRNLDGSFGMVLTFNNRGTSPAVSMP